MSAATRSRIAALGGLAAPAIGGGYSRPMPGAGYLRGPSGGNPLVIGPNPPLRDPRDDVRRSWVATTSRAIDAVHNSGWITAIVDVIVSLVVGNGLIPNFKPDMAAFGWDAKTTSDWARMVEARFIGQYGKRPEMIDAGARNTLADFQVAAVKQWLGTGETVVDYPRIRRDWGGSTSKVRLIPSHWLSQKTLVPNGLYQGVYLDPHGAAAGYEFDLKRPDSLLSTSVRKAARDRYGRTITGHYFEGLAGQVRGMTVFAPILRVLRDYDQLSGATLAAALLHAVFAATIESDYPTDAILAALKDEDELLTADAKRDYSQAKSRFDDFMTQKIGWHSNVDIDLANHGKIAHLMTGERLNLQGSKHPNSSYQPHANFLLREIIRAAGAQFEDVTGDYSGMTHATMKMATAKNWPLVLNRRNAIPARMSQAIAENWLEEEINYGRIPLPGGIDAFVANRAAICDIDWRGPPKPVPDELKAAKAHETYRNMGVMSDEMICADLGVDHEEVYEAREREKKSREEKGIHGGVTNGGTDIDTLDDPQPQAVPAN